MTCSNPVFPNNVLMFSVVHDFAERVFCFESAHVVPKHHHLSFHQPRSVLPWTWFSGSTGNLPIFLRMSDILPFNFRYKRL